MKRFSELSNEELWQLVIKSAELKELLNTYILSTEQDFDIDDRISIISPALSTYEIGFYYPSYINVKDYDLFVDCIRKCVDSFGCSDRVERTLNQCEKLRGTNLFEHYAKRLQAEWWEDEIVTSINYAEDACYDLYCNDFSEKVADYFEFWRERVDDYLYDEEEQMYYKPKKIAV